MALLTPVAPETSRVNTVVLGYNPYRYRQEAALVREELTRSGYRVVPVPTDQDVSSTASSLAEVIKIIPVEKPEEIGIGVVGGDGTTAHVIKASRLKAVTNLTGGKSPISPLAGGFAGDHRRSCHGDLGRTPSEIMRYGVIIPAHWIIRELLPPGSSEPTVEEAYMYAGVGKTAEGARRTNIVDSEEGKIHRSLRLGLGTLFTQIEFDADIGNRKQRLSDISVATIGRMSMVGFTNTEPWANDMRVVITAAGRVSNIISVAQLMLPVFPVGFSSKSFSFTVLGDVLAHLDGDPPDVLQAGTRVQYTSSAETYRTLTTRIAPRLTHGVQQTAQLLRGIRNH